MLKLVCKTGLGLLVMTLLGAPALGQGRIATVDLSKVFDSYYKTKQALANLEDRKAEITKDDKRMREELKKAKDDYTTLQGDANNQAISSEEREKRKKAAEDKFKKIRDMEEELNQYERQADTRLKEQTQRMHDNILTEITNVVNAKAKAGSYSLVFDTSARGITNTKMLLYSAGETDITQTIIDQLNLAAPPEGATEEKKDEKKDEKKSGKK